MGGDRRVKTAVTVHTFIHYSLQSITVITVKIHYSNRLHLNRLQELRKPIFILCISVIRLSTSSSCIISSSMLFQPRFNRWLWFPIFNSWAITLIKSRAVICDIVSLVLVGVIMMFMWLKPHSHSAELHGMSLEQFSNGHKSFGTTELFKVVSEIALYFIFI